MKRLGIILSLLVLPLIAAAYKINISDGTDGTINPHQLLAGNESTITAGMISQQVTISPNFGYAFDSWRWPDGSPTGGVEFIAYTQPMGGPEYIDVIARWKLAAYEISFHEKGATGTMCNQTSIWNQTFQLASNAFVRADREFLGWDLDAEGSSADYADCATVSNLPYNAETGIVDLYAVWKYRWQIKFEAGLGSGSMPNEQFIEDIPAKLSKCTLTPPAGCDFDYWISSAPARAFADEEMVNNLTETPNGIVALVAQWKGCDYHVAFDGNGAAGSMEVMDLKYLQVTNLSPNVFSRVGYDYLGWNDQPDGSGTAYADCALVSNLVTVAGATKTLYAQWHAHEYTIHFDSAGGTGETIDDLPMTYGVSCALPTNTYSRALYRFAGWQCDDDLYVDGEVVSNLVSTQGAVLNFVARWEPALTEFSDALDTKELSFSTNEQSWVVTNVEDAVGGSCVAVDASHMTKKLIASTEGGGTLSFYWKLLNVEVVDYTRLKVSVTRRDNGTEITNVNTAAQETWKNETLELPNIPLNISFEIVGTIDVAVGLVDNVSWIPNGGAVNKPYRIRGLVYNGLLQTGVVENVGYTLKNHAATPPGDYTAIAKLDDGFRWIGEEGDAATNDRQIVWHIAKATYDVSAFAASFTNSVFSYDGTAKSILGDESALPPSVTVTYYGNGVAVTGEHLVRAVFGGGDSNHELPADLEATMTIVDNRTVVAYPQPYTNLVYTGSLLLGMSTNDVRCNFFDVTAVNAGEHVATVALTDEGSFRWEDGSSAPIEIPWTIAKAQYDMSSVTFASATYVYDAAPKSLAIAGELPVGVNVGYAGNGQIAPGEYMVMALFSGDAVNYQPIPSMTATMKIMMEYAGRGTRGTFAAEEKTTFLGWLRDTNGVIYASLTVKTSKVKDSCFTSKITVAPIGGKKKTYKTTVSVDVGVDEFGIEYFSNELSGTFGEYSVEAGVDYSSAKDEQTDAEFAAYQGVYTFSAPESAFSSSAFSITVKARGRVKVSGYLPNGSKVSTSPRAILGADMMSVPVVINNKNGDCGFVLWLLNDGNTVYITDSFLGWKNVTTLGEYTLPADGNFTVSADNLAIGNYGYFLTASGYSLTPDGENAYCTAGKLTFDKKRGKVRLDSDGNAYVEDLVVSNLSSLKFKLSKNDGLLSGSCNLYFACSNTLKTTSVKLYGVTVDGRFLLTGKTKNTADQFTVVGERQ